MTKTALIENLTDGVCMKPKWQIKSERKSAERLLREQEAREVQKVRNKKIDALKKKWTKKLEDHQENYDGYARQLELFRNIGEKPRNSDWICGYNVGIMEILEELVKDLSEV